MGDVKMIAHGWRVSGSAEMRYHDFAGDFARKCFRCVAVIATMYASGAGRKLAERASRRGIGTANQIRWLIASQYHLPLGTFLGIAAVIVVFVFVFLLD